MPFTHFLKLLRKTKTSIKPSSTLGEKVIRQFRKGMKLQSVFFPVPATEGLNSQPQRSVFTTPGRVHWLLPQNVCLIVLALRFLSQCLCQVPGVPSRWFKARISMSCLEDFSHPVPAVLCLQVGCRWALAVSCVQLGLGHLLQRVWNCQ